jgi:DNA-binding XRE family transcriptional regulator
MPGNYEIGKREIDSMKKKVDLTLYPDLGKVAKRIIKLREKKDLSQGEAARILGMSRSNLKKIEDGEGLPSIPTILNICRHFNVSLDSIIFGKIRYPEGVREKKGKYLPENKLLVTVPHEKMVEPLNMIRKAWEEGDPNQQGWILVELQKLARQALQNISTNGG